MSAVSSCPLSFFGTKGSSSSKLTLSNPANTRVAPSLEPAISRQATISWLVLNIVALVFLVIGVILVGMSALPANVIMFSGAYFVLGSFLAFLTAGILVGTLIVVGRDAILRKTSTIEDQASTKNITPSSSEAQSIQAQDPTSLNDSSD